MNRVVSIGSMKAYLCYLSFMPLLLCYITSFCSFFPLAIGAAARTRSTVRIIGSRPAVGGAAAEGSVSAAAAVAGAGAASGRVAT